jgi:hypothetical protein
LDRIKTIITDDEISDTSAKIIEDSDVNLIVVSPDTSEKEKVPFKQNKITLGSKI